MENSTYTQKTPKDGKVVEPDEIDFGESNLQPDSLDDVVQQTPTQGTQTQGTGALSGYSFDKATAEFLVDQVKGVISYIENLDDTLKSLAAISLQLTKGQYAATVKLSTCKSSTITSFLENHPDYGPELAQTGIYEEVGINVQNDTEVSFAELTSYFPEFATIQQLEDNTGSYVKNPYLVVFTLPVELRPFFTGAIKDSKIPINNKESSHKFYKPLQTKHILAHAKKLDQASGQLEHIPKVKDYIKAYREA